MKAKLEKELSNYIEKANHAVSELHTFVIESQQFTREIYKKYGNPISRLLYNMNTIDMIKERDNEQKTNN